MLEIIVDFGIIFIGIFMALMIHELGHLIGGLISKYKFHSFAASLLIFYKENENIKFKFRKLTFLNFFGGYCMMIPPHDFQFFKPFWMDISGSFFNLLIAFILFMVIEHIHLDSHSALFWLIKSQMVMNFIVSLGNLIPLRVPQQTDGYNVIRGFHPLDKRSMYVFLRSLALDEEFKKGKRFKDLEPDLLFVEPDEKMNRFYVAYLVMMDAFYLLDKEEHEAAMKEFNRLDLKLLPNEWRCEIKCEMLYHYLVYHFDETKCKEFYEEKELKAFLQRNEATPKRVLAAYTSLVLGEEDKGERLMNEAIVLAHRLEGGYQTMELDRIEDFKVYQERVRTS